MPQAYFIREAYFTLRSNISLVPQGTNFIEKDQVIRLGLFLGGEGETRTPAPVTRPTPLAGAPRHQLEYFSMVTI